MEDPRSGLRITMQPSSSGFLKVTSFVPILQDILVWAQALDMQEMLRWVPRVPQKRNWVLLAME